MADHDEIQPEQKQDDELDVEELEGVAGGAFELQDDVANGTCPTNVNCPCA